MKKTILRREKKITEDLSSLHPLLQRVYASRNVQSIADIEKGLDSLLPYHALLGIDLAVKYLAEALAQQKHILIVGDFDADGATSTALAVAALQSFAAKQVSFLVPNRFEYGYGLTPEIVDVAAIQKPDLIITVDNGISSFAGVSRAQELGIKVIITDHHLPAAKLPLAEAIVNPNQLGDQFSSKNLAGVGVIFYLMLALRSYLREQNWFAEKNIALPNMSHLLDLVALGTVADVVPLDKNNRILVYQGLQRIRAGKSRPGIQALLNVAGRNYVNLTATDLGFAVAPRLNAAGRLDDMSLGIACLLSEDSNRARDIAVQLDLLNKERQSIEQEMQLQAQQALSKLRLSQNLPMGLCLVDSAWHQGVVGILASRIKDQLHRPVIAFAKINSTELKGSARSVVGVHIRDVLDAIATKHPDLITKFGGHAMAAGLTIHPKHFATFSQAFDDEIKSLLDLAALQGKIYSDGELSNEEINLTHAQLLRDAGPWGQNFPEPIFDGIFRVIEQRLVGQKHLKMILAVNDTQTVDAIAFNINPDNWPNHRCEKILAAYRLDVNEFRGMKNLQLMIEHLEVVE